MTEFTVVYALEEPPSSISASVFLAGPTPRGPGVLSWRDEALRVLKDSGFRGVVFVPEDRSGVFHGDYHGQVDWELACLELADVVLFWVPRELEFMPAFTTNVEFGSFVKSGKVVFGAPDSAPGNKYLKHLATKFGVPQESTLQSTVDRVLDILDPYALRTGGERFVPLNIWRTPSFQAWYGSLVAAGNVLNYACVKWSSSSVPGEVPFAWVLHVEVFVTSEGRVKSNEVVFARPDISTVLVYERAATLTECRVLLVKEFRSPGRTPSGFIQELPGGSSHDPGVKPREVAFEELWEEAGLRLDSPAALTFEGSRQLMGTFSSHQAHLFSFQVSSSKMDELVESVGSVLGAPGDSERTYVEVSTVGDLLDPVSTSVVDFSTLGMVLSVLAPLYA